MSADRCERCDRASCRRLASVREYHAARDADAWAGKDETVALWQVMMDEEKACEAARVDWRERCLAAEAVLATLHIDEAGIRKMIAAEVWRARVEPLIEKLRDANEAWSEAGDAEREAAQDVVCDAIDAVVAAAQKEIADA